MEQRLAKFWLLPHPVLRPYVDRYWGWSGGAGAPLPTLLPGTGAELFFHLEQPFLFGDAMGSRRAPHVHLCQIRKGPVRLFSDAPFTFVSVRIRSGALRNFGESAGENGAEGVVPAQALWGSEIEALHAALLAEAEPHGRVSLIDAWLLRRLAGRAQPDALIDDAVARLYYGHATARIDRIAESYSMSRRHFERRFKSTLGMSPKSFQRTARFHHTMRQLLLGGDADYLDTALSHGYYDQAHFIREFSGFVGAPPKHFLTEDAFTSHFYNPSLTGRK